MTYILIVAVASVAANGIIYDKGRGGSTSKLQ